MKFGIKWFWECNCEFPTTDLLRVTLVSVKESWGIRISLKIMRSTQVFNEVLYKKFVFYLKKIFNKNDENEFRQNKFLIMFFGLYMWISEDGFLLCHCSLW